MKNINELKQKRAAAIAGMREILDKAEGEKRDLSAEEKTQCDAMLAESRRLGDDIKREEELREAERTIAEEQRKSEEGAKGGKRDDPRIVAFRNFLLTGNPSEYRALANDSDASGGYLHAPEQFVAQLIKGLDNQTFVRSHATVIPVTSSDSLGAPTLDADPSDPTWTTEIAEISEDSTMAFGHRALKPEQLSKLIKVSMKLLRTSVLPVESIVSDRLAYKFGIAQENAFLNGDGDGEPLGIFTASSDGVPTSRDVSADNTSTALTADGLINAKFALKAQYRNKCRWIFHRDAMKAISKLKDGEGQYIWRAGLVMGEPDMLLGFPVDESEYVPNTFTSGLYVGALCNWEYYWIADLQGVEMQRLNELYARNSQIGFIGRMYTDGQPVLSEAFVRVKLG